MSKHPLETAYEEAYAYLMPRLEHELAGVYTYHNAAHTRYVIEAATKLCNLEKVDTTTALLVKTAALFHDSGFLISHVQHEANSCAIAREHLPGLGYNPAQIEHICRMIMATKLPQSPQDKAGAILCDADLFYLGTAEFEATAHLLYKELHGLQKVKSPKAWDNQQLSFLLPHKYFTASAQLMLNTMKAENIKKIEKKAVKPKRRTLKPREIVVDVLFLVIGILMSGLALKGFLVPNHFFDGGLTGISLLVHELYHFNLAVVIFLINLPLIIISYYSVGQKFALRMLIGVILLGICLELLPTIALTDDKLLISIFGGAFLGIGVGLVMRSGSALDGIEVLALYTLRKTSFTITEIILAINILIFSIAGFNFGIETSLYSILTYFTATRCIDYVVEGFQAYTGVTIISGESEIIKERIVKELGRGITVYKGERGFLPGQFEVSTDVDIIFTVITRLELRKLKNVVYEVDPKAFIFANTIKEAAGGVLSRRARHSG